MGTAFGQTAGMGGFGTSCTRIDSSSSCGRAPRSTAMKSPTGNGRRSHRSRPSAAPRSCSITVSYKVIYMACDAAGSGSSRPYFWGHARNNASATLQVAQRSASPTAAGAKTAISIKTNRYSPSCTSVLQRQRGLAHYVPVQNPAVAAHEYTGRSASSRIDLTQTICV
jgi:hypothetical protein